ncbi:MAG: hypothetical protein IKA28_00120 [Tidjanibacter sp.]|nr:hypothetical protein [Tidjanibacter sp.]
MHTIRKGVADDRTSLDESLWEAGEAEFIFGHAFDWSATPEGREFWRQIDRVWALSLGRK